MAALLAVSVALVLQASVFPHLAVQGVVPDLVLLVVVAAGLAYGSEQGLVSASAPGCCSTSRRRPTTTPGAGRSRCSSPATSRGGSPRRAAPASTSGCPWPPRRSFVGTSVFALTGLLLRDPAVGVGELLRVEVVALCWDVALALVVVPLTLGLFAKVEPDRVFA